MSESEDGFRDDEIERLHLSRLSNYSVATVVSAATTGDDVIKSESATDLGPSDLGIISEETDFTTKVSQERHLVTESSLSNVADTMVANVLLRVTENELKLNPRDNQRLISPFPDRPQDVVPDESSIIEVTPFPSAGRFPFPSVGNVNAKNAVAPTGPSLNPTSYDISTSSVTSCDEDGIDQSDLNNQELAEIKEEGPKISESNKKRDDVYHTGDETEREVLSTSVSLDRVQQILEERKANLSSSSSDEEERPKSTKSIRSRPRSASVGNIESADLDDFIDLPNGKPLTERRVPSSRNSEIEINQLFGSSKEINIFVGTWNLNLSTNINTDSLKRFLIDRNQTKCDLYVFGAQEIPVEGIVEWEVMIQRTLGRKYILLHAVRFGTLHLAIFIRSQLQSYCSAVDWGVLSVRAISTIKTKGVAACAVQIFGTKFIFMTSHLTAGEGEKNLANRILNYRTIREKLRLRRSKAMEVKIEHKNLAKKYNFNIEEFDTVFWFGDLNFRIDPDTGQDQLAECMKRRLCFEDFHEQKIGFMPTYKFNPNSKIYDTSRALRQPSYTDRILYKSKAQCRGIFYDSFNDLTHSDHRPVSAIFKVQVSPIKPCNAPLCMNNGEFVVSVYKAAFREHSTPKSSSSSRICTLL